MFEKLSGIKSRGLGTPVIFNMNNDDDGKNLNDFKICSELNRIVKNETSQVERRNKIFFQFQLTVQPCHDYVRNIVLLVEMRRWFGLETFCLVAKDYL